MKSGFLIDVYSKHGIITDVFVTPANVNDCTPHTSRLEYQIDKFQLPTKAVCADTAYDNSEVYDAMLKRGIQTYIPRRAKPIEKTNCEEEFSSDKFVYDSSKNVYICLAGKELHYSDYKKGVFYKRYAAKRIDCNNCPFKYFTAFKYNSSQTAKKLWLHSFNE